MKACCTVLLLAVVATSLLGWACGAVMPQSALNPGSAPKSGSSRGPTATPGCTPADRIDGIPANVTCLEQYVRTAQTTCPAAQQKRRGQSIPKEDPGSPPNCNKAFTNTVVNVDSVCYRKENPGKAPAYADQTSFNTKNTGSVTPSQALRNAKPMIDSRQYYSQCSRQDYHRIDCVGLIARAWHLDIMQVWTTGDLKGASVKIDCKDLMPGDILNSVPHVMLFHHWVDPATKEKFIAWQAADYTLGHLETTETLASLTKNNRYECYRYKCMKTAANPTPCAAGSSAKAPAAKAPAAKAAPKTAPARKF